MRAPEVGAPMIGFVRACNRPRVSACASQISGLVPDQVGNQRCNGNGNRNWGSWNGNYNGNMNPGWYNGNGNGNGN
ncbi:hypothetical protein M2281_002327 [Mesorhizobium soli]|nr:hypothetical protein [Mesorhizobium soli]